MGGGGGEPPLKTIPSIFGRPVTFVPEAREYTDAELDALTPEQRVQLMDFFETLAQQYPEVESSTQPSTSPRDVVVDPS
eukprot:2384462-Amphidinium_carterae.1